MSLTFDFVQPEPAATDRITLFCDVILPLPLPKLYTYRVPYEMNDDVVIGGRVIVQFGAKKTLSCIVAAVHETPPALYQAKYVLEFIDDAPVVTQAQLKLFRWMADYYMCTLGEVINAALPSALKLSSESRIQLHPAFVREEPTYPLSEQEEKIVEALSTEDGKALTFTEVGDLLGSTNFHKVIKSLIQKDVIFLFEHLADKFSPKVVKKVRLAHHFVAEAALETLFQQLAGRPKQLDVLMRYLQKVPVYQNEYSNHQGIEKAYLTSAPHLSPSAVNTLIKNGVLEQFDVIVSRFPLGDSPEAKLHFSLSEAQVAAQADILQQFTEKDIVLLHGVTGAGKTEIYIELIRKALEGGGQVLYLLPEIALTAQIVTRLMRVFGSRLGVYHSKFSDNERVEVWNGVLSGRFQVVVGVRSAVFLPFDNVSLIIVDEEHESSYKQYDPSPRYNAREVALMMANFQGAKTLLGSATPSVETYYQTRAGRWGLVTLTKRFGEAGLPEIELVDTRKGREQKTMLNHFTPELMSEMERKLALKEQVILFQNRRGYSPFINCLDCGWIPKCKNCAVSLSYHKHAHELRCHYCGFHDRMPVECPACGSRNLKTVGFGTEKIEDDLKIMLPQANVQRMDLDTTRAKNSYQQIIADFENQVTNVLVGTQMVTKGLDFANVSLVGIINADSIIHYPDFRAHERAFQMFVQVSGRAGRKGKKGKVIIQTADPAQVIFDKVIRNDYLEFYEYEITQRREYGFPPFMRVIRMTVKHVDQLVAEQAAILLTQELVDRLGREAVLGPEAPYIFRIRNFYLQEITIKLDREHTVLKHAKSEIMAAINVVKDQKEFKQARLVADVDPM
ncbi:replication restart DNA helicase PriA [Hymenobacter daecheongensis DSM 21074]|uniref:Replication restart protein PriA n=1 Tax=Hymenobacter daecheongensis DSM 21074 TaxID=1121955 RepID=A0A1M6C9A7_9BACT|nr:primosomal protein N' [Hymenobacter daecheongensis]SHI57348.1 replication restart DNA helicase PriA [Hymenobacter daecheongensis DSM 21074]